MNNGLNEDNKAALAEREGDAVWAIVSCRFILTLQCHFSSSACSWWALLAVCVPRLLFFSLALDSLRPSTNQAAQECKGQLLRGVRLTWRGAGYKNWSLSLRLSYVTNFYTCIMWRHWGFLPA